MQSDNILLVLPSNICDLEYDTGEETRGYLVGFQVGGNVVVVSHVCYSKSIEKVLHESVYPFSDVMPSPSVVGVVPSKVLEIETSGIWICGVNRSFRVYVHGEEIPENNIIRIMYDSSELFGYESYAEGRPFEQYSECAPQPKHMKDYLLKSMCVENEGVLEEANQRLQDIVKAIFFGRTLFHPECPWILIKWKIVRVLSMISKAFLRFVEFFLKNTLALSHKTVCWIFQNSALLQYASTFQIESTESPKDRFSKEYTMQRYKMEVAFRKIVVNFIITVILSQVYTIKEVHIFSFKDMLEALCSIANSVSKYVCDHMQSTIATNTFLVILDQNLNKFLGRIVVVALKPYINLTNHLHVYTRESSASCGTSLSSTHILGICIVYFLLIDIAKILFSYLRIIDFVISKIFRFHKNLIMSLARLFLGKQKNVLKNRIERAEYELDQLLTGMILFSILTFIFPTTLVYYLFFSAARAITDFVFKSLEYIVNFMEGEISSLSYRRTTKVRFRVSDVDSAVFILSFT